MPLDRTAATAVYIQASLQPYTVGGCSVSGLSFRYDISLIEVKPNLGDSISLHITLASEQGVGTAPNFVTLFLT